MSYGNEPTREPDHAGVGRAWRVPPHPDADTDPDKQAHVASWLVCAPHAGVPWFWYTIGCVHLRDVEGQSEPAHVQFPGASHELLFCALNPEKPIPDLDRWEGMSVMHPIDFVHQFIVGDDVAAAELTELVVRHVVAGQSPDQDFRSYWKSTVDNTAEHFRLGGHPDR